MAITLLNPGCDTCYDCDTPVFGCDFDVSEVTLDSSEFCLEAFIGTWAMSTTGGFPTGCSYNCRETMTSFAPTGHASNPCVISSVNYNSEALSIHCFRFNATAVVSVAVKFSWRKSPGSTLHELYGKFESTDAGLTFGAFQKDVWPAGCGSVTSTISLSGSDLTCSITRVF